MCSTFFWYNKIERNDFRMGRPKGSKTIKRYWTKEEKLKAVKRVLDNHEAAEA